MLAARALLVARDVTDADDGEHACGGGGHPPGVLNDGATGVTEGSRGGAVVDGLAGRNGAAVPSASQGRGDPGLAGTGLGEGPAA